MQQFWEIIAGLFLIIIGCSVIYYFGIKMTKKVFDSKEFAILNFGLGDGAVAYYVTKIFFCISGLILIYLGTL
jgi:hypothetical protein